MTEKQAKQFNDVIEQLNLIKNGIHSEMLNMERGSSTRHLQLSCTKIEEAVHRLKDAIN